MKFYDREAELELLLETEKRSLESSKMTFIVGRRRIGKTTLVMKAFEGQDYLYFFVSRKNEILLCEELIGEITSKLNKKVLGEYKSFSKLFEYLLILSQSNPFTLVLDEFQEFYSVNSLVYSQMQNLWDQYKNTTKMNLILSGSVFTLMKKIFENSKEPLFGRANEKIHLKPFSIDTLTQICQDYNTKVRPDDLLSFYMLTGGVAKYVELFADKGCFTLTKMLDEIFRENSLLLDEGKNILIEEFGKEYTTYFSILSLIASSKTSRREVESILGKDVGGYLNKLEKEYQIIKSIQPIFAKPGSRSIKYVIEDNFLNFWFRFIYKYRTAIEIGNYEYVRQIVERDYEMFSGAFLEKYFREKLALSKKYSMIGRFWNTRTTVEIDIVAVSDLEKKVLIGEVKRNKKKIDLVKLEKNAADLRSKLKGYTFEYAAFSLEDMIV